MKYLKTFENFQNNPEVMVGREPISLLKYAPEILNFFRLNGYEKTKQGLNSAISDWLDDEFYTLLDKQEKTIFIEKYFMI